MDFGKVEYICAEQENGKGTRVKVLKLTFIGQGDEEILSGKGIVAVRQKRIVRLALEAEEQGCLLSYEDLCALLLKSLSTVKRDVVFLEGQGVRIPLKNRRKAQEGFGEVLRTEESSAVQELMYE